MVEHLWMSGVVMAFLSFGIKAGMGMGSRIFNPGVSRGSAAAFFFGTLAVYLVLFAGLHLAVTRLDLMAYLDRIANLIQYGMAVHLAVALGLLLWGLKLLLAPGAGHGPSHAGLLLVLPCPVCATVILLNLTLALSLSSLSAPATTALLFALFWAVITATLALLALFRGRKGIDNGFLGGAMGLIALYFLATVLISPIYPKIKPAYSMAVSNNPAGQVDPRATLILAGACLVLAGIGFLKVYFKKGEMH
ncbi:MAG: hypothetical protein HUN04_15525 [Desulfobacter sp.]|nr:MAG: hypothetical protein HUN04_15525 [Desulfobacter sp.]